MGTFGKVALGVGCGILLAIVAVLATCGFFVSKVGETMHERKVDKAASVAALKLEGVKGSVDEYGYMKIAGTVRNGGAKPVTFIKLKIELLKGETVVNTDWLFVVDSNPLEPGQARAFENRTLAQGAKTFTYVLSSE